MIQKRFFSSCFLFIRVVFAGKWGPPVRSIREIIKNIITTTRSILVFRNPHIYMPALLHKDSSEKLLETRDGLRIAFRQNLFDARILRESFVERPYTRGLTPPSVVIDIGGYIGDFSLYAANRYGSRVYVYEPATENFRLLEDNVRRNHLDHLIHCRCVAVGPATTSLKLFVDLDFGGEIHVTSTIYGTHYKHPQERYVDAVSLAEVYATNKLTCADLLKIDIEGAEYDVLDSASDEVLTKARNIVFEYHPIPGHGERLKKIISRLRSLNYKVSKEGSLIRATAV